MVISSRFVLVCVCCAVCCHAERSPDAGFTQYKSFYGRTYADDSAEHRMRQEIFEKRLEEVEAHNARDLSWKMGINHLTDWTHAELKVLNGHRPIKQSRPIESLSFLEIDGVDEACSSHNQSCEESSCCSGFMCGAEARCTSTKTAPAFDWTNKLLTAREIVEQGSCGSCWAMASAAVLNMHGEIVSNKRLRKVLSPQSLLTCPPNKLECGGQGGCQGGTAEVAYAWLKSMGPSGAVKTIDQQPYTAKDGSCSSSKSSFLQAQTEPAVSIQGFKKLRENDAAEMMKALVTVGPLVASIAANGLFGYSKGVMDGCKDNIINHAVVLTGFGHAENHGLNYWNVRNSWGKAWGEDGFFRLKRADEGKEEPCGWDDKPEEGVACKDKEHGKYPNRQWVCGECGFLTDTVYPIGTRVPDSFLDVTDDADQGDGQDSTVHDNTWCKTECQHFGMQKLSKLFDGADFGGDDPTACMMQCDSHVPPATTA